MSGIGSDTEPMSRLIDTYLHPHVTSLPTYIQDTPNILKWLEGIQVPPNTKLVAIEKEALYSSIPHSKGLSVVKEFLSERPRECQSYNLFWLRWNTF